MHHELYATLCLYLASSTKNLISSARAIRLPALGEERVAEAEDKTLKLLAKLEQILTQSASQSKPPSLWLFGTAQATALDGHVVPLLARLLDVGRGDMLGSKESRLNAYLMGAYETEAWKEVMQGRTTVYAGF